jgi:hypothetical protein
MGARIPDNIKELERVIRVVRKTGGGKVWHQTEDGRTILIEVEGTSPRQSEAKARNSSGSQTGEPTTSLGPKAEEVASAARAQATVNRLRSSSRHGSKSAPPASPQGKVIALKR